MNQVSGLNEDPRLDDPFLTDGVLTRRAIAWLVDATLIGLVVAAASFACLLFGILTLGLGMVAFGVVPLLPFAYNYLFLTSGMTATPGQALMGLAVRRLDTLEAPNSAQALVSTVGYYVTLATSGLLLLAALLTRRHRTLHDVVSGLVVVRSAALRSAPLTGASSRWNMPGRYT